MRFLFSVFLSLAFISCASPQSNYYSQSGQESGTPVTDEMTTPYFMAEFAKSVCGIKSGDPMKAPPKKRDACNQKWRDTYFARLGQAYSMGDSAAVNAKCQAYPIECQQRGTFEHWARESHESNLAQQSEYNNAVRLQAVGGALQGLSRQLNEANRQPAAAPLAPRQCRTRSDGFGGFVTDCFP